MILHEIACKKGSNIRKIHGCRAGRDLEVHAREASEAEGLPRAARENKVQRPAPVAVAVQLRDLPALNYALSIAVRLSSCTI